MMRMGSPQQGHGSRRVRGMISASGPDAAGCSGRWTQSKVLIVLMLALRAELQCMGERLWRRQNDHSTARSSHRSLPHPRDRQRQLLLQGQLRNNEKEEEGNTSIDAIMTHRT